MRVVKDTDTNEGGQRHCNASVVSGTCTSKHEVLVTCQGCSSPLLLEL